MASTPSSQVPSNKTICTTLSSFSSELRISCQVAMNRLGELWAAANDGARAGSARRRFTT